MDKCDTFRDCRTAISLSFLKVSHLHTILCGLYESPNEQNRMCELCTFSQIWSQIMLTKQATNSMASTVPIATPCTANCVKLLAMAT